MQSKILITICARKGSKGLPGKNTKILHGKPLIEWTIDQALAWGKGDIVVSTDDPKAAQIAWDKNVSVIMRPPELAGDNTPKFDVIAHVLDVLADEYDTVIDLDITNPMRTVENIEGAYKTFKAISGCESVVSVTEARKNPYFNQIEYTDRAFQLVRQSKFVNRQSTPDVYDMNASICVMHPSTVWRFETPAHVTKLGIYIMPEHCAFDIDTHTDWLIVEKLMEVYGPF